MGIPKKLQQKESESKTTIFDYGMGKDDKAPEVESKIVETDESKKVDTPEEGAAKAGEDVDPTVKALQDQINEINSKYAEASQKVKDFEAAEEEARKAKLSTEQKLKEEKEQIEAAKTTAEERAAKAEFKFDAHQAATRKGFKNPGLIVQALLGDGVTDPEKIEERLDAYAEADPYLLVEEGEQYAARTKTGADTDGSGSGKTTVDKDTAKFLMSLP